MANRSSASVIKWEKTKSVILLALGSFLTLLNGLIVAAALCEIHREGIFIIFLIFTPLTALGLFLFILGCDKQRLINLFYNYSIRLAADPEKSIDRLAGSIGSSSEKVEKNLKKIISLGFMPNCYIDEKKNKLVIPDAPGVPSSAYSANTAGFSNATRRVTCKNCGAGNNVTVGIPCVCEYCGAKLL